MEISPKIFGIAIVGAFVAGSFLASPELRAYASTIANDVICTGCVGPSDIAGNAVTAAKIKDGEVKAAEIASNAVGSNEIASDAVGGSELQGVRKLLFGQCSLTDTENFSGVFAGGVMGVNCSISGVQDGDSAVATLTQGNACFEVERTTSGSASGGTVQVHLRNDCASTATVNNGQIAIIVFDK